MKKQITQSSCGRALLRLVYFAMAVTLLAAPLHATSHTWSGAVNGNWSTAGNWSSGGVPVVGEANLVLRFPASVTRYQSTNNIAGLSVQSFQLNGNGHHLYGNAVTMVVARDGTNFIMAPGGIGSFLHLPLTLPAGSFNVYVELNATLEILSPIGGAGGLDKYGRGLLRLNGADGNTFTGAFRQYEGLVGLGKTLGVALPGSVFVGTPTTTAELDMTYEWSHQIADASDVHVQGQHSQLSLEGYDDTIGSLDLVGGRVQTWRTGFSSVIGVLRLNGDVTAGESDTATRTEAEIFGRLNLGNAQRTITVPTTERLLIFASVESTGTNGGITLTGGGNLQFAYSNSFDGPLRIPIGEVYAYHSHAFGSPVGATILEGGQLFIGYGCFVQAEPLEVKQSGYFNIAATNAWNGPIYVHTNAVLSLWSSPFGGYDWITLGGVISGPGKMWHVIDRVDFTGAQANTLSGGHFIRGSTFMVLNKGTSNALTGPITLDEGFNPPTFPTVLWNGSHQVSDASRISWPDNVPQGTVSGMFDLSGYSDVVGSIAGGAFMAIQCDFGKLTVGADNLNSLYTGAMSGTGSAGTNLVKVGAGAFVLGGNHSLAGKTWVAGGTLILSNATGLGPVHVNSGARLAGTGQLGALTAAASGSITPGVLLDSSSHGILQSTSFSPGGGFLGMDLSGTTPGIGYDQIVTAGAPNLSGVLLQLGALTLPHGSNSFTLINVTGAAPVSGTFVGLPEGAVFPSSDGKSFLITYHGGTGNDVVVTRHYTVPPGGQLTGVTPLPDGRIRIGGTGLPETLYQVQANTNLNTMNWIFIGSSSSDEFGTLEFIDAGATNFPMRFYRLLLP